MRYRRPRSRTMRPEDLLKKSVRGLLERLENQGHLFFDITNAGTYVLARGGAVRGMRPGTADVFVYLPGGRLVMVELKSKTGKQNDAQKAYQPMVEGFGFPYYIARDVAGVYAILRAHGVADVMDFSRENK
jgi:hypothetical protein